MRRRQWILALGAGLCGSLPACALKDHAVISPLQATSRRVEPPPPVPPDDEPASPYAAVPVPKTVISAKLTKQETQVNQVKYREQPKVQEVHTVPSQVTPPQIGLELAAEPETESQPEAVSKAPKAEEPALLTALRCFLNQRPQDAIAWLRRYDEANQELLLRLLPVAVRLTTEQNLKPVDVEKGTAIVEEFNELLGVPPQGNLLIDKVCLCEDIKTFGNYKPFPDEHLFQPRDLVWIYVEVRNFTCVRSEPKPGEVLYETRLNTSARIKNFARTREWDLSFHRRYGPDQSRARRHDYWDSLSFNMPDLPPGRYTLEIEVEDGHTGRKTNRTVDFQVGLAGGSPFSRGSENRGSANRGESKIAQDCGSANRG
jgi:hypothetical protein